MLKKLTKHGNSLALVIDRPILDPLKIDTETPLDFGTDGTRLIVAPVAAPAARKRRFEAAQEWAHRRYGKAFEKLAKQRALRSSGGPTLPFLRQSAGDAPAAV
jgi:antitoxin component of MazEF toxin-antitoxin module